MTQSDKDFITRIQVSQLVTQDPYAEDFYAQTYSMIMRSKMGLQNQDLRVLNFGSGGGVGLGMSQRPSGRRASAMQKMEAQVEKIVQAARIREKEKGMSCKYIVRTLTAHVLTISKRFTVFRELWARQQVVATRLRLANFYKSTSTERKANLFPSKPRTLHMRPWAAPALM